MTTPCLAMMGRKGAQARPDVKPRPSRCDGVWGNARTGFAVGLFLRLRVGVPARRSRARKKTPAPRGTGFLVHFSGSALVALAGVARFARFRTAGLPAVGALAWLTFDAAVLVGRPATPAIGQKLACGENGSGDDSEYDFHVILSLRSPLPRVKRPCRPPSSPAFWRALFCRAVGSPAPRAARPWPR